MAQQVRISNSRPIKLRRLFKINNAKSMAIIIPKSFVQKMELVAGNYMSCEMNAEETSLTMSKCSVSVPAISNAIQGDEED